MIQNTGANAVTLAGILSLQPINSYTPAENDSIVILDYSNVTGAFDTTLGTNAGGGLTWNVSIDSGDTNVTATS